MPETVEIPTSTFNRIVDAVHSSIPIEFRVSPADALRDVRISDGNRQIIMTLDNWTGCLWSAWYYGWDGECSKGEYVSASMTLSPADTSALFAGYDGWYVNYVNGGFYEGDPEEGRFAAVYELLRKAESLSIQVA